MKRRTMGVLALGCLWGVLSQNPLASAEGEVEPVIYGTDFEGPDDGWTRSGLWAVDGTPSTMTGGAAYSGAKSLNYNNGVSYNTGSRTVGTARSPSIVVDSRYAQIVSFRCNYKTETTGPLADRRVVRIYRGTKKTEVTLSASAGGCAAMGAWHPHTLSAPAGSAILRIEFAFDSVTSWKNNFPGWFVDDLKVARDDHGNDAATATALAASGVAGSIETAGDVDYFRFTACGPTTFTVETYDLAGGMDTVLYLYSSSGTLLAYNDDAAKGTDASKVSYTHAAPGVKTYSVKIKHLSSKKTGTYRVRVTGASGVPSKAEWVSYPRAPGQWVDALVHHPSPGTPAPAVIYNHGGELEGLPYAEAVADGYDVADFVDALAQAGYVGIAPLRDEGTSWSDGTISSTIQYLKGRGDVDPKRIFLMGFSRGGLFSLQYAVADDSELRGLILLSPSPGAPGEFADALALAGNLDVPVFVGLGADEPNPEIEENVKAFVATMQSLKKTIVAKLDYPGDHHWFWEVHSEYWKDVVAFLDQGTK